MSNCPDDFYNNCINAIFKCNKCKANTSKSTKLYYSPVTDIGEHPATHLTPSKNYKRSVEIKQGYKEETKVVKEWIHKTAKSGSVLGDADIKVGDLKLDVKKRTKTSNFNVTKSEFTKGNQKGYDGWVIVNQDNARVVCLTETAFLKLTGKLIQELI